jgi:hypothetical protein
MAPLSSEGFEAAFSSSRSGCFQYFSNQRSTGMIAARMPGISMRKILAICGCLLLALGCAANRGQQATNPHPIVFRNQLQYAEGVMESPNEAIQAEGAAAIRSLR